MRDLDSTTARELAQRWANDLCPALAVYAASLQITPGLLAEIDYLIIRQAHLMRTSLRSRAVRGSKGKRTAHYTYGLNTHAAKVMAENLLTFRRMVHAKLEKAV